MVLGVCAPGRLATRCGGLAASPTSGSPRRTYKEEAGQRLFDSDTPPRFAPRGGPDTDLVTGPDVRARRDLVLDVTCDP